MSECKYPHLFSPITLGNTVFRNRIFGSPTGPHHLNAKNYPIRETCAYYERKAIGGAASVCIGDCIVDPIRGRSASMLMPLYEEEAKPAFYNLAEAISRHGAVASVELQHGGSHSFGSMADGHQLYGVVEGVDPNGNPILPMTDEIIEDTIEKFANAALYAKNCGFGMVTVHGGHGWLLTQFLSPLHNTRTDQWGGSPENRARLPIAICEAIKRKCGAGFPVEMRISGSECHAGGYDIETGIEIAEQLDGHLDLIHVSAGDHEVWEVFTVTHPSMFLEDGVNVKYAAEIKKHVHKSRIATVGALADPALMEEIIASGKADVVEVARGLFADPDLPLKARTGREDEIRTCMRCLACFSGLIRNGQFSCAINPVIGHELENKTPVKAEVKKKILIAGGGIAGMEAAITASNMGHEVILCEKTESLGGALKCERDVSFKKHLDDYIKLQRRTIAKAPIDVRLNTEVTPELARELKPDVLIAALGARPMVPTFIKGYDLPNVVGAEEVYYDPAKAGKSVVILGGGLVGAELAIHLSEMGRKCTIIEMLPELNNGGNILHGVALGIRLRDCGVEVHTGTKALEITDKGVIAENADGQKLYEGDTVIYAIGQKPLREEADELRFCAPEFHQIGDCLSPKNITEATKAAYYIVRDIGRF